MRPDAVVALAVLAAALAACSDGTSERATTTPGSSFSRDTARIRLGAVTSLPPTSPPSLVPDSPPPVLVVTGGELPTDVVSAIRSEGGALVEPGVWAGRFGFSDLPAVEGPGVTLVEARRSGDRDSGAWRSVDEASWLVVDESDTAALLDGLARAAGLGGAGFAASTVEDRGAVCDQRFYEVDASWSLQACDYQANYPDLFSLGVSRYGTSSELSPVLDATVSDVLEVTDGEVVAWSVELDRPNTARHTLTFTTQITFPTTSVNDTGARLAAGPFRGWARLGGDRSEMWTGPSGVSWTIGAGYARLDWAGVL